MRKLPKIKYFSPLGLFALTACGGENSTISSLLNSASGNVFKGPLNNALVYADYDDASLGNSASVRTDENGKYTLSTVNNNYTIVAITDESTIDKSSGAVMSGVTLKAPAGATVVTPTSTLMEEGGITAAQVVEVLGLPEGIDPLTFNAFDDDVNAADALAVEQASHQIMSVVNAFAAAAEGSGASEADAFDAALNSIVEVVKTKVANLDDDDASASDKKLDLSNTADLALIKDQAITEVASIEGVTFETTTAFDALADDTATAVENVNTEIAKAVNLTSDETKSIFSTTQVLADQVKTAAVAEVETSGTGSIDFTDSASVVTSAANAMPSSIDLSLSSISEGAESLVVGVLSTVDSDQPDGVAFKYEIAEITETDYASFSINQSTGELSLIAQPDYETKSTYSVTILSTDSGGKTLSETFNVAITDANDAPTLTVPTGGSVTEDADILTITGSLVGSDLENDSLTYSVVDATPSSGSYSVTGTYGTLVLNATTGAYIYTLENSATVVQALGVSGSETETFSVKVSDGTNTPTAQTLSFTINGANDAPSSIALDSMSIVENSAGAIVGALSGVDAEGTSLSYSIAAPGDGASFEIDSSNNLKLTSSSADFETKPTYTVTVDASDGIVKTSTEFSISVTDVNEAPTWEANVSSLIAAEDDDFSYDLSTISSDDDDDELIYELIDAPDWVTLSDGVLAGTPSNVDIGVDDIKLKASDGTLAETKDLRVDVTNTNDAPKITSTDVSGVETDVIDLVITVNTGARYKSDGATGNVFYIDGEVSPSLEFIHGNTYVFDQSNSSNTNHPLQFQLADGSSYTDGVTSSGAAGTTGAKVTFVVPYDAPADLEYYCTIHGVGMGGEVTITAPVIVEDAAYSYTFEASDVDVGDTVTLAAPTKPSWLSFDTDTGILSGTPTNSNVGDSSIVLTATDASSAVDTQSFTLTITNTNDAPIITSTEVSGVNEDAAYSYKFEASDVDVGDTVTLAAPTKPSWLNFDIETGILTGTPTNSHVGNHSIVLTATDASSVVSTQNFTLKVTNTNDAPTAANAISDQTIAEDSALSFQFSSDVFADVDADDSLTYTATLSDGSALPTWLSFDSDTRTFSGTPLNDDVGAIDVKVTATDSGNAATNDTYNLTVTNTDDASLVEGDENKESSLTEQGEDSVVTVKGSLTITDEDVTDNPSFEDLIDQPSDLGFGTVSLANGEWIYTLINSQVNELLGEGDTRLDSYTFEASDGSTYEIEIEIIGIDDDNIAPTVSSFSVVPESSDILGPGDTVVYTATASEAMRADTSMSITLSNNATVTLTVVEGTPTTLEGTYTISASDDESDDLTISTYTALTAVDLSGNALDTSTAIGGIDGNGTQGIEVDTLAPTAKISAAGHTYNASTGVLTLAAETLSTMGAADGAEVKTQVDMTKLTWDINKSGSSLETFTDSDVTSVILTDTNTLTITFTTEKAAELAGTTDFGGEGASLDGLDIAEAFLKDNVGNASEQGAVNNAGVAMADTDAPTVSSFSVVPQSSDILGPGDTVVYTATASEAMRADTSMSITLSNNATVTLTVVEGTPTTLEGTYTISASDDESDDLTISTYTALTAVDLSGNALDTSTAIGGIDGNGTQGIEVDTLAPTAKISPNGHTYDVSTGVLTLAAERLSTMGAADGAEVKTQVDMTKLTWDINKSGSSLETFTDSDVTSVILTDTNTLTITFTTEKAAELAGTTDFGGEGASLDGLDIAEAFLKDNVGNASEQGAVSNADVAMSDTDAPTVSSFSVVPQSSDILGAGDTVVYTATASEAMRADTSMSITLSNNATVTLTVVEGTPTTLEGTYTISASDDESLDLTISQYTALTAVDLSGNALDTSTAIGEITGAGTQSIVVDTQAPTAAISAAGHTYNASTGVLTLAAETLSTMGAADGAEVKTQVDMTKLTWDINKSGSSLETFTDSDVTSVILTDTNTLTITFTTEKAAELAGTTDFGGEGASLDGLDIAEEFLKDNAGNASEQGAVNNAGVAMSDTDAPTVSSFSVVPQSSDILGIGDTVVYTATASEAMRADTSMSITLSNNATVTLTVVEGTPTTLEGTYTISASDDESDDLTISQYTALTAVDISGNALDTSTAIGEITGAGTQSIEVDTLAPTAAISAAGHTYNAATGVLTLAAETLSTMGAADGAEVKTQVDMTKLSWDINKSGSSLETFTDSDVTSVILTDTNTLTITFTTEKAAELAGTTDFGGQGASLDGLDIAEEFLKDNAGNASEQGAVSNADVAMSDTDAPTVSSFSVVPQSSDILGIGDTVVYTATASEAMRADTSMSITLSNNATVTLTVVEGTPTTLEGTYTISDTDNDDSNLTISQYTALTAVDISGNALDTSTAIGEITGAGTQSIELDATTPTLASAQIDGLSLWLIFSETLSDNNQNEITALLESLEITDADSVIAWNSGQNVNVETTSLLNEGDFSIDLTIEDLAGNTRTYTEIDLDII